MIKISINREKKYPSLKKDSDIIIELIEQSIRSTDHANPQSQPYAAKP